MPKRLSAQSDQAFEHWLAPRRGLPPVQLRRELERVDVDTLDRWAFGVAGDEVLRVDPDELTVVHADDLANAQHQADRHPGGPVRWARRVSLKEPVDVIVDDRGEFLLDDGHHRYLAARLSGRKLSAKIVVKGRPIERLLERAGSAKKTIAQLEREVVALGR